MKYRTTLFGILAIALLVVAMSGCDGNDKGQPTQITTTTSIPTATATSIPTATTTSIPTTTPTPNPLVSISAPQNNSQQAYEVSVAGTSNATAGQTLWVIVHNYKNDIYYPQTGPVTPEEGGSWSSKAYLGTPTAGKGESFDIIAVLANQSANSAFLDYKASEVAKNYPGMKQLSAGIIEKSVVTVMRT